ncbi:unnamed protein product, partial [marine sediment metagenome]
MATHSNIRPVPGKMKKTKLFTEEFRERVINLFHALENEPLTESQIAKQLAIRGGARKH